METMITGELSFVERIQAYLFKLILFENEGLQRSLTNYQQDMSLPEASVLLKGRVFSCRSLGEESELYSNCGDTVLS